jgi:hypothetical protein
MRDPGDPPVSGALVSNQHQVTVTDEEGRWALPAHPEMVTFVTAPRGYRVPVDSLNLPRFHHVHRPAGSPAMRYEGIAPTGPLPERVDLGLILAPEPGERSIRAAIFADPQTSDHEELSWYRDRILAPLAGEEGVDVGFILGDIMNDDLALLPRYARLNATTGIPTFHVVGNHDLNFDAPDPRYATDTFIRWFGPTWYMVRLDDVVFVVLNNIHYEGSSYEERGRYRGRLGEDQLAWVEAMLAHLPHEDRLVFMAHVPFAFFGSDNPSIMTEDREALFRLVADRPNVLFLAGHTHSTAHQMLGEEDGWTGEGAVRHLNVTAAAGGWWRGPRASDGIPQSTQRDGTPHGYHLFDFDGVEVLEVLMAQGPQGGEQLRLSMPAPGAAAQAIDEEPTIVNVFNAGDDTRVELRVGEGPWQALTWLPGSDPFFVNQLEQEPESFGNRLQSLSNPLMQASTHRWIGPSLGALLREVGVDPSLPDAARIEIRATRPDGSVYRTVAVRELGLASTAF